MSWPIVCLSGSHLEPISDWNYYCPCWDIVQKWSKKSGPSQTLVGGCRWRNWLGGTTFCHYYQLLRVRENSIPSSLLYRQLIKRTFNRSNSTTERFRRFLLFYWLLLPKTALCLQQSCQNLQTSKQDSVFHQRSLFISKRFWVIFFFSWSNDVLWKVALSSPLQVNYTKQCLISEIRSVFLVLSPVLTVAS